MLVFHVTKIKYYKINVSGQSTDSSKAGLDGMALNGSTLTSRYEVDIFSLDMYISQMSCILHCKECHPYICKDGQIKTAGVWCR